jgi:hypothetical protein
LDLYIATGDGIDQMSVDRELRREVKRQLEVTPDRIVFEPAADIEAKLFSRKLKAEWIVDLRPNPVSNT